MSHRHQDGTIPDPLTGRGRSRVDAFMPLSSLGSLRPAGRRSPTKPVPIAVSEPTTLPGGCRLYRLPASRDRRNTL